MPLTRGALAVGFAIVASGCLGGSLPGADSAAGGSGEGVPRLTGLDLSQARVNLTGTACQELLLVVAGDADALEDATPGHVLLASPPQQGVQVTIAVIGCEAWNGAGAAGQPGTLAVVGTPIQAPDGTAGRHDRVLAVLADDQRVAAALARAGLPARVAAGLTLGADRHDRIATHMTATSDDAAHPFTASATAVSLDIPLPVAASTLLGREAWAGPREDPITLDRGMDVTQIGGASGTLETAPGSRLHELVGARSQAAYGFQARYDIAIGVVPAS